MRSKIYYLLIVLFTIHIFSCTDEPLEPTVNDDDKLVELTFISPGYEEVVDIKDINDIHFEWICSEEGPFKLSIADDSTFQNIVLDSIVSTSQLSGIDLLPGRDYFWKVEVKDDVFESTFTTRNLLLDIERFNGEVSMRRYDWDMGTISNDTTYTDLFEFTQENKNLIIKSEFDLFEVTCELVNFNSDEEIAYYLSGGGSNYILAKYYYLANKINFERQSGGIGGNRRWRATFQE